jgi:hypothetical protein
MVQTLPAKEVTLRDLTDQFGLTLVRNDRFFPEWQEGLPNLTEFEMQVLDKIKAGYENLRSDPPVLERAVQLSVIGPMLFLADFYLPPFHIRAEQSTEVTAEDEDMVIRGKLDVLLLKDGFWLMVIESKGFKFSPEVGVAQLLAYMLSSPDRDRPIFGLIASGSEFQFFKLVQGGTPQYAMSDHFATLNRINGLYDVFRIMKRIGQL